MRVCSEHKRQNNDIRVRQDLADILAYCKQHGHRPPLDSDFNKRIAAIYVLILKRKDSKHGCPCDFIDAYNEIKSYPTYDFCVKQQAKAAKELQEQQAKAAAELQAAQEKELIERNTRIINKYFPESRILRRYLGEDKYQDFIKKTPNPFGLKVFSELIKMAIKGMQPRLRDILMKTSGIGITDQDIQEIESYYAENNIVDASKPSKAGLLLEEMGHLFCMSGSRVGQLLRSVYKCLEKKCDLSNTFAKYMADDVDGMLTLLPRNLQLVCKFQKEYNLLDAPTKELISAADVLLVFKANMKRLHRYEKIEQVFPKLGLFLKCLSTASTYAEISDLTFVLNNCDINDQALKILSVFFEDLILQHSSTNMDILLKRYGYGITDTDVRLTNYRCLHRYGEYTNASKQGLSAEQLAALYYLDTEKIKTIVVCQMMDLCKKMEPMYKAFMSGNIDEMISVLPKHLRQSYEMQLQHHYASDEATKEMFEAGRALYNMSVFGNEKTK